MTITFEYRVYIGFEYFKVEKDKSCAHDWLQVYDNSNATKICGDDIPNIFQSSGNSMTIMFHSDDTNTDKGFEIITGNGKIQYSKLKSKA